MSKETRAGGKYAGSHSTLIPAAVIVCDIASKCPEVTRISLGYIKTGLKSANGHRRVKITQDGASILLSIRDNTSHQEVRVYATDIPAAIEAIAEGARDKNLSVALATPH